MTRFRNGLALALTTSLLTPLSAQAWVKTLVVESFEAAFHYGGPDVGGARALGTDCPKGVNANDWEKGLLTAHRSPELVNFVLSPETPSRVLPSQAGFRGENGENVYENPTSVRESGKYLTVEGAIAEGFDLDNNPNTGFTSPTGQKGIDNAFYKASGCNVLFREKPGNAQHSLSVNDAMYEGLFTTVVVIRGEGADPMNDPNVTVGFYPSNDKIVKDAHGAVAWDYTFKAAPDPNFSVVFKAKTANGVLENDGRFLFKSMDANRSRAPMRLEAAMVRFKFAEDGSVSGLVGGYRDVWDHHRHLFFNGNTYSGGGVETLGHISAPDWFYALRRAADGLPDKETGQMRGISTAYRYNLVPAIVVTPSKKIELPALDAKVVTETVYDPLPRDEQARLKLASFTPIADLAAEKREIRRVSFRDPFGTLTLPAITIEEGVDGQYGYTLTSNAGVHRSSGVISAKEWKELTADDWALSPRQRPLSKTAAQCYSKEAVIEAVIDGKVVRREASLCGAAGDRSAVLYSYKLAALVINNSQDCRDFINVTREPAWALGECLRQQQMDPEEIRFSSTYREPMGGGSTSYANIVINRNTSVASTR